MPEVKPQTAKAEARAALIRHGLSGLASSASYGRRRRSVVARAPG